MNPLERFTDFVGNEIEYRTNEFKKAAQETRTKAENNLKVRKEREASAGRALTNIKDNTVSSIQRADNNAKNVRAIRKAEFDGDTSQLTEEQKDLSRPVGSKSTLNGKPVKWSGQNYGWQSEDSYNKLEEKGEFRGGEIGYSRINNDMADGIFDTLGEENAIKLGDTIQFLTDEYERVAPGKLKEILSKGGELFNQLNEEISRTTNISSQITSEVLIELATAGAGKLAKKGGGAALRATQKADLPSRVQELQRGLRGRNARPLNTGGSVGAAGAPRTADNVEALIKADPYTGRRLYNDAAEGIQTQTTRQAPANTVTRGGARRNTGPGPDIIDSNFDDPLTPQQRIEAYSYLNLPAGVDGRQVEQLMADGASRAEAVQVASRASARPELPPASTPARNRERNRLFEQADQRRNDLDQRPADGDVGEFAQRTRGEQAQANVVRRREAASDSRRGSSRTRRSDANNARLAQETGSDYQGMQDEYDTVRNNMRMRIGMNAPGGAPGSEIPQGRITAQRPQNTIGGRDVISDSENRAMRHRIDSNESARLRIQREQLNESRRSVESRNRIAGNPNRQSNAVNRARAQGNELLAETNQLRIADLNSVEAQQRRANTRLKDSRTIDPNARQEGSWVNKNRALVSSAREGVQDQYEAGGLIKGARSATPGRRNTIDSKKVAANRKNKADNAANIRANREQIERQRIAEIKQKRYKSSIQSRQAQGAADATAAFENGPQPVKGGEEGSRLFTPRNRAEAAKRAGSKLNKTHSQKGVRNAATGGGKGAYANLEDFYDSDGYTHDVGFRSMSEKGYARDTERKLQGKTIGKKSRTKKKLDSAAIKNNLATIFSEVKQGDTVTATAIDGVNGRNGRARIYERMSKGALKADADDNIRSARVGKTKWRREDGKVKEWDPEELRKDLDVLTQATPEQLRGRAIGGNSKLRIQGKNISGTKALSIDKQARPKSNTRTNNKRQQQALNRISKFAEKNGMSAEEAVQYLQSNLN